MGVTVKWLQLKGYNLHAMEIKMKTFEIEAKGLPASKLYDLSLSVPKFYPLNFTHLSVTPRFY